MRSLWSTYQCDRLADVHRIFKSSDLDPATKAALLASALPLMRDDAASSEIVAELNRQYAELVHVRPPATGVRRQNPFEGVVLERGLADIQALGLDSRDGGGDVSGQAAWRILPGTWRLSFTFTLATAYFARDDAPLYFHENPLRKEKVFRVPYVSAGGWKGMLRAAAMRSLLDAPDADFAARRAAIAMLFGSEKDAVEEGADAVPLIDLWSPEHAVEYARLMRRHFGARDDAPAPVRHAGTIRPLPTFFSGIDLDVINPHARDTRTGRNPIKLEIVPAGTSGMFDLLCVPSSRPHVTASREIQARVVFDAICDLFLAFGFSAKASSGYGRADDQVTNGRIERAESADAVSFARLSELRADEGTPLARVFEEAR